MFNVPHGGVDGLVRGRLSGSTAARMRIDGARETPREKGEAGELDGGSGAIAERSLWVLRDVELVGVNSACSLIIVRPRLISWLRFYEVLAR